MTIKTLSQILPDEELEALNTKVPNGHTPLWEYWSEFVTKYLRTGKSISTVKNVRDFLKLLMRNTNICSIEQCLDHRHLEDVIHKLKENRKISDSTFNTYLKNLNTYFLWLERQDYIPENKIRKIMRCKECRGKQLTARSDELKLATLQLINRRQTTLERKRNLLFFGILKLTGARPIELERMKVGDIYASKNGFKLVINGAKQNSDPRYYRLPSWLRDLYLDYLHHRNRLKRNEDSLLVSQSKRSGWTRKGMTRLLTKLSKEIGVKITAYSIRRHVATTLHASGMPLEKIADYLGQKRTSTTLKYIEESCIRTLEASEIMSNFAEGLE